MALNGFRDDFKCFLGCFFADVFHPILDVILYAFWELSGGPQTCFLQYVQFENAVFRIRPNFQLEATSAQTVIKNLFKMEPKPVKHRLKNQSKNESDFEAQNGSKMAPKMSPGTAKGDQKRNQKRIEKPLEKKPCKSREITQATQEN